MYYYVLCDGFVHNIIGMAFTVVLTRFDNFLRIKAVNSFFSPNIVALKMWVWQDREPTWLSTQSGCQLYTNVNYILLDIFRNVLRNTNICTYMYIIRQNLWLYLS